MDRHTITLILGLILAGSTAAAWAGDGGPPLPPVYGYRATDLDTLRRGFAEPPRAAGPWVYWFWFDNVVTREEISRELEEMAAAGIAGAELRCVTMHGFPGPPGPWFDQAGWARLGHKRLDYLSDEYLAVLEHTLREAQRLGLKMAINLGMGWPPGGTWITEQHRSKLLTASSQVLEGPRRLDGPSAIEVPANSLVLAWKLQDGKAHCVAVESFRDLSRQVGKDGRLQWDVPTGRWLVGIFRQLPGGVCDKGDGPEADPGSRQSVLFHLNHLFGKLQPRVGSYFGSTLTEVASDSWEYTPGPKARHWSPALPEVFASTAGQSLPAHLYALLDYGPDREQVLADLDRAERETVRQNFFTTTTQFLNDRGLRHRPQVRGRGLARDFFEAFASADVPEIEEEVYLPEAVWVAHTLGLPIVSAEAVTFISGHARNLGRDGHRGPFDDRLEDPKRKWETTPDQIRRHVAAHLARGINRVQLHGFSYSPPGVPAPGWRMYAEVHLNRNAACWPSMKKLSTWIARNQWVLQAGGPVADVVVYPVRSNPPNGPYNTAEDQPISAFNAVDAASPATLPRLAKREGTVAYDFRQLLLLDDVRTLDEVCHLARLVDSGASLICCKALPAAWTALKPQAGDTERRDSLRHRFEQAVRQGTVSDARAEGWKGAMARLQSVGWTPADAQLTYQHRRVRGGELYFLMNWGDSFHGAVSFPEGDLLPEVWDADTGQMTSPRQFSRRNGRTIVTFDLAGLQSAIVVFAARSQ